MRQRLLQLVGVAATIVFVSLVLVNVYGQTGTTAKPAEAAKEGQAPKTPWGEPDLQGIWSVEFQTALERPAEYAGKEIFTEQERAELDKQRASSSHFGDRVAKRGTESDVTGAYNSVFTSQKHTGRRTSLIVDPPDGKVPPLTPEARKRNIEIRQYQLALLQATQACKDKVLGACEDGKYGPPSPKRAEVPPHYMTGAINRSDNPEDRNLGERCMSGALPEFRGGFTGIHRRIVQSPGIVYIYYDSGQGQGWHRVVPITTTPHLPPNIQLWWGDSRGRWEGNALVVDVTNFSPKTDFQGSRENLHLIERWTRTSAGSLELVSTMEDPTTWTKPWTVSQEFAKQSDHLNRIYTEPRCHEGNYGLLGLLAGGRADDKAFKERRGPNPATKCLAGCGVDPEGVLDPLALR